MAALFLQNMVESWDGVKAALLPMLREPGGWAEFHVVGIPEAMAPRVLSVLENIAKICDGLPPQGGDVIVMDLVWRGKPIMALWSTGHRGGVVELLAPPEGLITPEGEPSELYLQFAAWLIELAAIGPPLAVVFAEENAQHDPFNLDERPDAVTIWRRP